MFDELSERYEGRWWLPDHREHAVGGTLALVGHPTGPVLRLNGGLRTDASRPRETWYDFAIVHGESIEGDRLTLLRAAVTGTRSRIGAGPVSQELAAEIVLFGEHLGEHQAVFATADFEFTDMAEWAEIGGSSVDPGGDETTFSLTFHREPPRRAAIPGLGEVTLDRDFAYSAHEDTHVIRDFHRFHVAFETPSNIDATFSRAIGPLQNLLTFAMSASNLPRRVFLGREDTTGTAALGQQQRWAVYKSGVEGPTPRESATTFFGRLFDLRSCPVPVDELLQRWVALGDRLGSVIDLYLSLDYAPPTHFETRFLNVCQAAEGYHRVMLDERAISATEFAELKATLRENCPPDRLQWLNGVLMHADEPSFRQRIERLVERAGPTLGPLVAARPKYLQELANYRNQFAHWLSAAAPPESMGDDLYDLIRITRFVLAACLLKDLGWSDTDVNEAFDRNPSFKHAVLEARRQQ